MASQQSRKKKRKKHIVYTVKEEESVQKENCCYNNQDVQKAEESFDDKRDLPVPVFFGKEPEKRGPHKFKLGGPSMKKRPSTDKTISYGRRRHEERGGRRTKHKRERRSIS